MFFRISLKHNKTTAFKIKFSKTVLFTVCTHEVTSSPKNISQNFKTANIIVDLKNTYLFFFCLEILKRGWGELSLKIIDIFSTGIVCMLIKSTAIIFIQKLVMWLWWLDDDLTQLLYMSHQLRLFWNPSEYMFLKLLHLGYQKDIVSEITHKFH